MGTVWHLCLIFTIYTVLFTRETIWRYLRDSPEILMLHCDILVLVENLGDFEDHSISWKWKVQRSPGKDEDTNTSDGSKVPSAQVWTRTSLLYHHQGSPLTMKTPLSTYLSCDDMFRYRLQSSVAEEKTLLHTSQMIMLFWRTYLINRH